MKPVNFIFFAAAIIISVVSVSRYIYRTKYAEGEARDQLARPGLATDHFSFNISKKTYLILLAVIAFAGIAIRIWKFGTVPGGFNQDGAMAAVDGKALAEYMTDRFGTWLPAHLYAWGYGQMSSLLSYMQAFFIKIFGLSPVTARMPQLIASIAGGSFFCLFMKDTYGRGVGLIAAAFVAFNPWHLVQSRWALDCNLLPHFFMGGLYFLNKGFSKNRKYTYISMLFFALCMYCYGITIYTIPPFLLAVCICYLVKKKLTLKDALISAAVYFAVAWPFLLTMMVNFFKWDTISLPFVTIQYFSGSVRSSDILFFSDAPVKQLGSNFMSLMNTTILQKKDLPWNDIQGFGTMFLCSMPFAAAGIAGFIKTKTEYSKGLTVFALLTGIWAGIMTNNVNVNRINIVYYGIMMFIVLGIYFSIRELKYAGIAVAAIYAVLSVMLTVTYFGSYADTIEYYFYDGFGEALAAAEDSGADRIYVTADAQGVGYWNVSEILTLFYDKTDAEYFQGKKNENNGKNLLPYKERFTYESMTPDVVARGDRDGAAFVIMKSDSALFDELEYEITEYGDKGVFCAAVKR